MCTVTIVPRGGGFRLVCNRDERRDRPPAIAPSWHAMNGIDATFPVDPQGGGTWIGLNTAGLAAVLLNRTDGAAPRRTGSRFSRGMIIPPLLESRSVTAALRAARRVNARAFEPFRLALVQRSTCAIVSSDGTALSVHARSFHAPLMFTSSSLGDDLAAVPRRAVFEQDVLSRGHVDAWLEAQQRFHEHRWEDRPETSVLMSRPDARTVSRTVLDVLERSMTLRYEALNDQRVGPVSAAGRAA
jgi:Transport and Golgi organisation 2